MVLDFWLAKNFEEKIKHLLIIVYINNMKIIIFKVLKIIEKI